jgi:hypothetical protein
MWFLSRRVGLRRATSSPPPLRRKVAVLSRLRLRAVHARGRLKSALRRNQPVIILVHRSAYLCGSYGSVPREDGFLARYIQQPDCVFIVRRLASLTRGLQRTVNAGRPTSNCSITSSACRLRDWCALGLKSPRFTRHCESEASSAASRQPLQLNTFLACASLMPPSGSPSYPPVRAAPRPSSARSRWSRPAVARGFTSALSASGRCRRSQRP